MKIRTRRFTYLSFGLCLAALAACAGSTLPPEAAFVRCKLEALRVLPADPQQATVADARDLVARLQACHQGPAADGGTR